MTRAKISEYSATAGDNTDVNGVNIAEGCPPSGINDAIREVMGALKRFETGSDGDSITVGGNLVVSGSTTANTLSTTVLQSDTISEKTSAAGVTVDGVLLKDSGVVTGAGTASAPVYSTTGDTNTGIFFPAADTIAFAEGGAEAMRIDSSGNVLIAQTSNVGQPGSYTPDLSVTGLNDGGLAHNQYSTSAGVGAQLWLSRSKSATIGQTVVASGDQLGAINFSGSDGTNFVSAARITGDVDGTPGTNDMPGRLRFLTTPDGSSSAVERMRIDSSGNVGIGTTSPTRLLDVSNTAGDSSIAITSSNTGQSSLWFARANDSNRGGIYYEHSNEVMVFRGNDAERARITSDGDLLVGTTTANQNGGKVNVLFDGNATNGINLKTSYASTGSYFAVFINSGGTLIGRIEQNGASTVAYTTSSDYRLKENVAPMTGALAKILELNPVTYTWRVNGSAGQGFLAHELQAVCPEAVTGEKDATEIQQVEVSPAIPATFDDDGNELTPSIEAVYEEREVPLYQGVDTSFLVATLTAAIQELKAITDTQAQTISALEARIAALEN